VTKEDFGHEQAAERLLVAVAEGLPESVERARELVAAVLGDAVVRRAAQLEALLGEGSPLALVRAVELAEIVLRSNTKLGAEAYGEGVAQGTPGWSQCGSGVRRISAVGKLRVRRKHRQGSD